jgi:hypothetical protein
LCNIPGKTQFAKVYTISIIPDIRGHKMTFSVNGQKKIPWISIIVVFAVLCILPVSAMTLSSTKYTGTIAAGEIVTYPITIGTQSYDNPTDYTIAVMGFGQNQDGVYIQLDPGKDTSPNSARQYISLDKSEIHVEPGSSQTVTATIALPPNAGEGGRYATIYIYTVPSKGQAVTTAVVIPVMITISGTKTSTAGTITSVGTGEITVGQPITVTTSMKNTGNYHYLHTFNMVTVTDAGGNIISNSTTEPSARAIIPGNTVQYTLKPDVKDIEPGTYTIDSKILLESGTVLAEKKTSFTVKTDYVPPVTESSITLTPGSAGTLTSPDGRYSISFPQGAVLGDVVVILKPYSNDKLKPAPANANLGATSFEVSGLSGLLSRDATVRVTYSADDLTAAGGDASKLKLAYYDAARNTWVILPTQVDTGSTALTATTNHLSVWAVMVSSSTTTTTGATGGIAPVATATKSPVPVEIILMSIGITVIASGNRFRKQK